jgi:hypothetical protein
MGFFCPVPGPINPSPSHCAAPCFEAKDCTKNGYTCKVWDRRRGCGVFGARPIGEACDTFTQCEGIGMCLPWINGYCAISDCDSVFALNSGPCPTGAVCVPISDDRFNPPKHFVCLKECQDDQACRVTDGYHCRDVKDDAGASKKVCLL